MPKTPASDVAELRSCETIEVAVLGFPDGRDGLCGHEAALNLNRLSQAHELCQNRGGCPGIPDGAYGLCGRKATLNLNKLTEFMSFVKVDVDVVGSDLL